LYWRSGCGWIREICEQKGAIISKEGMVGEARIGRPIGDTIYSMTAYHIINPTSSASRITMENRDAESFWSFSGESECSSHARMISNGHCS
jgi:hypothetical protein